MVFKDQAIWKETDWSVILHRYHIKTLAKEGKSKILSRCYITGNELTSLPSELCYLIRLVNIGYSRNPIEYIPPQVVRFLERIRLCEEIYTDSQSVHNSSVQQTFRETVFRLANKKPELDEDETIKEFYVLLF
jgi:Leucine-rich repeat (LRR) protein